MKSTDTRLAATAVLAALLLAAPMAASTAVAQTTSPTTPQANPEPIPEAKLKSFAAASLEIEKLNEKWSPKIASAGGPQRQAEIRDQAMQEMAAAARDEGLSVQEYNQIVNVAQADPATARTVEQYRTELR